MAEKLTKAQSEVLSYLGWRNDFDGCPAASEISYGLRHQYRDWADGKLKGLLAKGLVEGAGTTFSNARTWRITTAPADARTLALVELLSTLWQERRTIQDMANDPAVSDEELRSFCRLIALPPTREDMAWALKQMENAR